MASPQTFHGPFEITVTHVESSRVQELVVQGSNDGGGRYPGTVGETIRVDGDTWTLDLEWYQPKGGWRSSLIDRQAAYTVADGLVFTLRAQNGPVEPVHWKHLRVSVASSDPALNPMHPPGFPPDFTIPKPT